MVTEEEKILNESKTLTFQQKDELITLWLIPAYNHSYLYFFGENFDYKGYVNSEAIIPFIKKEQPVTLILENEYSLEISDYQTILKIKNFFDNIKHLCFYNTESQERFYKALREHNNVLRFVKAVNENNLKLLRRYYFSGEFTKEDNRYLLAMFIQATNNESWDIVRWLTSINEDLEKEFCLDRLFANMEKE